MVRSNYMQMSPDDWDSDLAGLFSNGDKNRKALTSHAKDNPALKILAPVDRAQDSLLKEVQTQARLGDRVPKVQEFVELVEQNRINPQSVSDYAAQSWPAKPEEFFAEAYSLWCMNPSKLPGAAAEVVPGRPLPVMFCRRRTRRVPPAG